MPSGALSGTKMYAGSPATVEKPARELAAFPVEAQAMDWATLVQRRAKQDPVDQGGWSVFHTSWGGVDQFNPAVHAFLRGNAKQGIMGWPNSPTIEALRAEWFLAPDLAAQKKVCETMQLQVFRDVPYIPLGQVRA